MQGSRNSNRQRASVILLINTRAYADDYMQFSKHNKVHVVVAFYYDCDVRGFIQIINVMAKTDYCLKAIVSRGVDDQRTG